MKETRRYNLLTGLIQVDLKNGKYIEYADHLSIVEQLQARIKELESERDTAIKNGKQVFEQLKHEEKLRQEFESAERTLNNLGYQNLGGEMWKPPVNKPNPLITDESLRNEIKAQGIEEAIKYIDEHSRVVDDDISYFSLAKYIQKLRTKHD